MKLVKKTHDNQNIERDINSLIKKLRLVNKKPDIGTKTFFIYITEYREKKIRQVRKQINGNINK